MKCGGWKYTGNEDFDEIVNYLSKAEGLIALGDNVFFEDSDQYILLYNLAKIKGKLNSLTKYVGCKKTGNTQSR